MKNITVDTVKEYFKEMKKNWHDSASYGKILSLEYEAINWAVYNLSKDATPDELAEEASIYLKDVYGQEVM